MINESSKTKFSTNSRYSAVKFVEFSSPKDRGNILSRMTDVQIFSKFDHVRDFHWKINNKKNIFTVQVLTDIPCKGHREIKEQYKITFT